MSTTITSNRDAEGCVARVEHLIGTGAADDAVALAESLDGHPLLVKQIQAIAFTGAAPILGRHDLMARALELWREFDPDHNTSTAYNLGNAEVGAWELVRTHEGFVQALESADAHIGAGRVLYRRVAEDNDAPLRFRLQALTNLGNNYDHVGRDLEALDCYEQALALDQTFAMAWGNHGVTLTHVAPWMGEHSPTVLHQGLRSLDHALSDRDGVLSYGGEAALRSFETKRAQFDVETRETPDKSATSVPWTDPYLEWVRQHNLFLHVSPNCLHEDTDDLDPLFFRSIVTGLSDDEQQRINTLVDAFNTLKQDYITSRYLLWLSTSPDSPIREHTSSTSERTKFLDSLSYARWGIRTGTALQAFNAAVNLLDKTASFVHLYLRSPRLRDVYFTTLWHRRNAHSHMDPTVSAEILAGNRGLLALCDLSSDVRRDTGLSERLGRRHAATHRFLVAHWMGGSEAETSSVWLERANWSELVEATIQQLHTGRAALLYLARTIDIRERRNAPRRTTGRPLPTLQIYRAETERSDFD